MLRFMVKSNIPLQEDKNKGEPSPAVEEITKEKAIGTSSAPLGKIKIKRKKPIKRFSLHQT